jgi:hypothetical protein
MSPLSKAALLLVAFSAACHRAPVYESYADPAGRWSMDAPKDWIRDGDVTDRKPVWETRFVGAAEPQLEGRPLGAVLTMRRVSRRRADFPGDDAAFKRYDAEFLKPARALFGDDGTSADQKQYDRSYEISSGPSHGDKSVAVRAQGAVYRTADAYYDMQYLAARENFAQYHYAFERARLSFEMIKK